MDVWLHERPPGPEAPGIFDLLHQLQLKEMFRLQPHTCSQVESIIRATFFISSRHLPFVIDSYLVRLIQSNADQLPPSRLQTQPFSAYFLRPVSRPSIRQRILRKRHCPPTMQRNTTPFASGKFWTADIKSLQAKVSHLQSGSVAI